MQNDLGIMLKTGVSSINYKVKTLLFNREMVLKYCIEFYLPHLNSLNFMPIKLLPVHALVDPDTFPRGPHQCRYLPRGPI